jgi:membrane protease YdiL (CAAX protease family)
MRYRSLLCGNESTAQQVKRPLTAFGFAVLGFFAVFWGAQLLAPGTAAPSVVLILATIAGVAAVRPGWNIRPNRPTRYWALLLGLIFGSAALAAGFLSLAKIPMPYDLATLNILAALPGVVAVTGIEELLFRQVMFRWLKARRISGRGAVLATSVAFGCAHLGPLLTQVWAEWRSTSEKFRHAVVGGLLGENHEQCRDDVTGHATTWHPPPLLMSEHSARRITLGPPDSGRLSR